MTMLKWILAPASVLATISLVVFVLADLERMTRLRSIAAGGLTVAFLATLGAGLFALYERKRH